MARQARWTAIAMIFGFMGTFLLKGRQMSQSELKAEALRGYQFFPHPTSPTLGVLRLDTESAQSWFLVDRKTLNLLSEALAKHAQELRPTQ
jgi:hypothetical protein